MIEKMSRTAVRQRRALRVRKKVTGTAEKPRLCVFRSNKNIEAQLIDDVKGVTLVSASSTQLKLANGGNCEAAAKVGKVIGERALQAGIKNVVFDRGGFIYHGKIRALADAAREAGLEF